MIVEPAFLYARLIGRIAKPGQNARANCDITEGHRSTMLAHLGNLSGRLGRPLKFDPTNETIPGDTEAASFLGRKGRGSFVIPE